MQNVLLQMGLQVVSVDGMLVKRVKQYVLKCEACFKQTEQMEAVFCPSCGNNTLYKVAIDVSESGVSHYELRKRNNLRGTKYSIPMPKGGKKHDDMILREDQLPKRQRSHKEVDLMDPDSGAWTFNSKSKPGGRGPKVGHARR